jgi:hypothetical protein
MISGALRVEQALHISKRSCAWCRMSEDEHCYYSTALSFQELYLVSRYDIGIAIALHPYSPYRFLDLSTIPCSKDTRSWYIDRDVTRSKSNGQLGCGRPGEAVGEQ